MISGKGGGMGLQKIEFTYFTYKKLVLFVKPDNNFQIIEEAKKNTRNILNIHIA